jgi:hypothetical protein
MQKKALVIRHLYNEDNIDIPDDTVSSVTDASGEFDESDDAKTTEIMIPEVKICEVKTEQEVRIKNFFNRFYYFFL